MLLAGADAIHVVGQRRAFGVAAYLAYTLGQLGTRAHLLDGVGGMTLHQANLMTPRTMSWSWSASRPTHRRQWPWRTAPMSAARPSSC